MPNFSLFRATCSHYSKHYSNAAASIAHSRIRNKFAGLVVALGLFSQTALSQPLQLEGDLKIDPANISGLVITDQFMAVVTDEGNALQILPKVGSRYQSTSQGVIALTQATDELDLEGLAWQAPHLYAVGSHSKKRKRLDPEKSDAKNIKRLGAIYDEPARTQVFRLTLSPEGKVSQIESFSALPFIENDPILAPFLKLPSKENGIDIEGIAVRDQTLYLGFRGPVIRGNLTPVLQLQLSKKTFKVKQADTLWLNLGGFGIRDMVATPQGFTLLTGPVNELPDQYQLVHWRGNTQLAKPLAASQPIAHQSKPEGITWFQNRYWLVEDGLKNGGLKPLDASAP